MSTPSSIEKLSALSAQRTARTDRLHELTCALLPQLEKLLDVGESVTVDGYTLSLERIRSNVGTYEGFTLDRHDSYGYGESCWLDREIDSETYLHGDFSCMMRGPNRAQLLAFAQRAERFIAGFIAKLERESEALAVGQESVLMAKEAVRSISTK